MTRAIRRPKQAPRTTVTNQATPQRPEDEITRIATEIVRRRESVLRALEQK